jgi:hypothetical protein
MRIAGRKARCECLGKKSGEKETMEPPEQKLNRRLEFQEWAALRRSAALGARAAALIDARETCFYLIPRLQEWLAAIQLGRIQF